MNANGRDPPGAADVHADVEELRGGLLGRVLVGDRPAGRAGRGAEPALQRHLVHLHHHAVDLVLDVVAVLAPVRDVLEHLADAVADHRAVRHRQPPRPQGRVGLRLAPRVEPDPLAEPVADQPQVPRAGDARVLLPQRTRSGVARVRERRLPGLDQRRVERLEVGQPEVHLAPHLDQLGHGELGRAGEPLGDLLEGAHVQRDVFAGAAVATGQSAGEQPVLVEQVHREPVDLQLAQVRHLADLARDPLRPGAHLVRREGVVEAEHPLQVIVRREVGGELAAHLLRGRVGRRQLRMFLLELHQLAPQRVELPVGDDRRIEHVVAELVVGHLGSQPRVPLTGVGVGAHDGEANEGHRHSQPGEPAVDRVHP